MRAVPVLVTSSEHPEADDCPYRLEANAHLGLCQILARPGPTLAITPLQDMVEPLALPTTSIDPLA